MTIYERITITAILVAVLMYAWHRIADHLFSNYQLGTAEEKLGSWCWEPSYYAAIVTGPLASGMVTAYVFALIWGCRP